MQEIADKLGMEVKDYFRDAIKRGLSQREMAVELDVTPATVCNWMRKCGFQPVLTYRERKGKAA